MKGTVLKAIEGWVKEAHGAEVWGSALESAGLPRDHFISPTVDIDDSYVWTVGESLCKLLGLGFPELVDAVGEYWVCVYTPKVYPHYYRGVNSARELFLKL